MCEGYGCRSVCVFCYHISCYIPGVYDASKVILGIPLCCNHNECTGVQNPHRYMHAYNIAGDVSHGSLCILFNARSIELHTLHLNRVVVLLN